MTSEEFDKKVQDIARNFSDEISVIGLRFAKEIELIINEGKNSSIPDYLMAASMDAAIKHINDSFEKIGM